MDDQQRDNIVKSLEKASDTIIEVKDYVTQSEKDSFTAITLAITAMVMTVITNVVIIIGICVQAGLL